MQKRKISANKRVQSISWLCVILVLMAAVGTLAITGGRFGQGGLYILKTWGSAMNLSMDLEGGVYTEYLGVGNEEVDFETAMAGAVTVLESRLNYYGFTDSTVLRVGTDRIRVEIPRVTGYSSLFSELYVPAKLSFVLGEEEILTSEHVLGAASGYNDSSEPITQFAFTTEGSQIMADATANAAGQTLSINLDDVTVASAILSEAVSKGQLGVTMSSIGAANQLAVLASSGALDITFERTETADFSPRLGAATMDALVWAFAIFMILAVAFLLLRYRMSGLVGALSLGLYILVLFFILAASGVQVTLAGMLGIGLGLVLAVAANILIFERIREEAGKGRALLVAIKNGFQGARPLLMDLHMAVIIFTLSLMILGTASFQSLAHTLAISALVSLFGATLATRVLMRLFTSIGGSKPKLYVG